MRNIEVKDAMIIARGLMCEATMTNNTWLNSIASWVVDLNDRNEKKIIDKYYRGEPVVADLCVH